ncbi:MAG: hypothetical protein ABIP88_15910 [Candidatus Binatia bacterium]
MKCFVTAAVSLAYLFYCSFMPVQAGAASSPAESEWTATLEAAQKEGQLTIHHTRGPFENVFGEFAKRYPGIKITSVSGRGGDLIAKIMAERRADKFIADMYLGSSGTPVDVLYPAKALEPIQSYLIRSEVKDPANWFGKQHHYADPEGKYIYVFEGVVRSDMAYNTKLVDPKSFVPTGICCSQNGRAKSPPWTPSCPAFPAGYCNSLITMANWARNS